MILPEDHPASPPKAHDHLLDAAAAPNEAAPPPAYDEHQPLNANMNPAASTSHAPLYVPTSASALYPSSPHPHPHTGLGLGAPEPAGKRFFRALAVALLVWVLLAAAADSVVEAARRHHPRPRPGPGPGRDRPGHPHPRPLPFPAPGPGHPGHPDGRTLHCADWAHARGRAVAAFDLPLDADALYVFARGAWVAGTVVVTQDEDEDERGDEHERGHEDEARMVRVDVAAVYSTPAHLEHVRVCAMERRGGERGVGIFTPYDYPNDRRTPTLDFEITVRLPKLGGDRDRLELNTFETRLPMFAHQLAALGERVHFQSLDLQSQDSTISSQSVNATKLAVRTSNAPIRGVFHAAQSLLLSTTNGVIDAHVALHAADDLAPAEASLETSNAPILAHLALSSAAPSTGGLFKILTTTTNERLALTVPRAPLASTLDLVAQTTNAPARVQLAAAFEGEFDVRAEGAGAAVEWGRGDPAGRGRVRQVEEVAGAGRVWGRVLWEGKHMGRVEVGTTNAPVVLTL